MNDPSTTPVDIEEQRGWVRDLHKTLNSWSEVGKRTGIAASTVQAFAAGKYGGNNQTIADKVFRYRQMLVAHRSIVVDMPERPAFYETETALQLIHMLTYAQRYGRIAVGALGPGNSKSEAARHYRACFPNVFLATMTPSTAGVNTMQIAILEAMGYTDVKGTPQKLSKQILDRCKSVRNPLLILDETQHLTGKALEEIRSWNDAIGVGIALFGNAGVLRQLEGGNRQINFAQMFSRVGLRLEQQIPLESDVEAMAEAWTIYEPRMIGTLKKICLRPGGLRNGTHVLELAHMLAAAASEPLSDDHIGNAWAQLSTRTVAS